MVDRSSTGRHSTRCCARSCPSSRCARARRVVARVAARGEGHGVLVLAGVPLTAQLPDEVEAGADAAPARRGGHARSGSCCGWTPQAVDAAAAGPAAAAARAAARRRRRAAAPRRGRRARRRDASRWPSTRRRSAALDLRLDLAPRAVQVGVEAPPGAPFELADGGRRAPARRSRRRDRPRRDVRVAAPPRAVRRLCLSARSAPRALRYDGHGRAEGRRRRAAGHVAERILARAREARRARARGPAAGRGAGRAGARPGGAGGAVDGGRRGARLGLRAR